MRAAKFKTVVRQVDPLQERRRVLLALGVLLLVGVGGFFAGKQYAVSEVVPLEDASAPLQAAITHLETRAEVDRSTIATLRGNLADSRARVSELERELVFYRGVLAPEEQGAELLLREPTLIMGDTPGAWQYQFVVQQGARNDSVRRGDLNISVGGRRDGEPLELPLADLDGTLADNALPLNFRYFQRFDGELMLPEGFVPERVIMRVTLSQPRAAQLERGFPWPGAPSVTTPDESVDQQGEG